MLTLCGQVFGTYESPVGVDKKTGEEFGGQAKVQLLCQLPLKNGAIRGELVTLTTDDPQAFNALQGREVRVSVGAYSLKAGTVGFFCLKGQKPEALTPSPLVQSPAAGQSPDKAPEAAKRTGVFG
jgi:hypothetical protein